MKEINEGATDRSKWWLIVPVTVLILVALLIFIFSDGSFSRTCYWQMQENIFYSLNSALTAVPNPVWKNITFLGDASILFCLLTPLLLWKPQTWFAMLCTVPIGGITVNLLKYLTLVPRPAMVIDLYNVNSTGYMFNSDSFPSGHSLSAFGLAIAILVTIYPRIVTRQQWIIVSVCIFLAISVCLSRVALGAHWPLDIIVGASLGWLCGLGGAALANYLRAKYRHLNHHKLLVFLAVFMFICAYLLSKRIWYTPYGEFILWTSTISCAVASLFLFRQHFSAAFKNKTAGVN